MNILNNDELEVLNTFRNIIVWGYPLHSHTQSYIHGSFFKAFKVLHNSVHWFHDKDYPSAETFDYSNSLFLGEGWGSENIPVLNTCTYFVNFAKDPFKYLNVGARIIDIRFNVYEINDFNYNYKLPVDTAIKISEDTLYEAVKDDSAVAYARSRPVDNRPYEAVYLYWATDLLPSEFNFELASHKRTNNIYYIASTGGEEHPINKFKVSASQNGKNFIESNPWNNPISYDDTMKLMIDSYCAPDFRSPGSKDAFKKHGKFNGTNHLDIGYIPCRIFKAISYGQTGITNSPRVKEILGEYVEYCEDPTQVISIATKRMNDVDWRIECMKHVQSRHTYIHRIRDLARVLLNNPNNTC